MTIGRGLIMPVILCAAVLNAGHALAQTAFPAPLPEQSDSGAPAVQLGQRVRPGGCMEAFLPLREDAESRGKLIKAAADRHATPQEACELIGNYSVAELKMIRFVEANAAKCGIPTHIADQLKAGRLRTEQMFRKVCDVARQARKQGPAGPSGDFEYILVPPSGIPRPAKGERLPVGDFDHLIR